MNKLFYALIPLLLGMCACSHRKDLKQEAKEDYRKSLEDSVAAVRAEIDSCRQQAAVAGDNVDEWLRDFTTVTNPREVGSYLVLASMKHAVPPTSTSLVARINDSNGFELTAALKPGKAFDRIEVIAPEGGVESGTVPHDQALNYRTDALTTVTFTGARADSIGALVADNELNPLTVVFRQDGTVAKWKLPAANAKMIAYTWMLYDNMRRQTEMERRAAMLHQKLNILRIHQDSQKAQ